jgi:4-carboxymuconolactone decarboxylase
MNDDETRAQRRAKGLECMAALGLGTNEPLHEIDEELWRIVTETNFGDIWTRPGLTLRERELVVMGVLIALGASGVKLHFQNAHTVGISTEQIREVIFQVMPYAGLPKALHAMHQLKQVLAGEPLSL